MTPAARRSSGWLFIPIVPAGDPINDHFETTCAYLAEHFGLTVSAVLRMDRQTLYAVYYHPRDKEGRLQPADDEGAGGEGRQGPREARYATWRKHGLWEPELLAEWWDREVKRGRT